MLIFWMSKVYQVITDRIIELLESGSVPWHKPWKGFDNAPKSLVSGKPYRGINTFMCASAGYESPWWLSFKQAKERNGHVRKGERGWPCIYWNYQEKQDEKSGKIKKSGFIRHYTVFNVEQTEGVEYPQLETYDNFEPIQVCEDIVEWMPNRPELVRSGTRARYNASRDIVEVPQEKLFKKPEEFYSTLFHELSHSTGHPRRLNRPSLMEESMFGSHNYIKEELVAEMGAAYLCGHTGIENVIIDNSAAYINSWLSRLKQDKTLIVQAASQAQKSTDYILGEVFEDTAPKISY